MSGLSIQKVGELKQQLKPLFSIRTIVLDPEFAIEGLTLIKLQDWVANGEADEKIRPLIRDCSPLRSQREFHGCRPRRLPQHARAPVKKTQEV